MNCKPRILATSIAALALAASITPTAQAQTTYFWNSDAGGSWGTAALWTGGVPTGAGNIADFSIVNITADRTVTLDGARTIGKLKFGDGGTASHNWILNTGTAGPLTLDSTTPGQGAIEVVNQTATIGAVIAGNDGLIKTGIGTLVLTAANTFTGDVVVNGGASNTATLRIQNAAGLGAGAKNVVVNVGTTAGGQGTTLDIRNTITVASDKTLTLNSAAGDFRSTLLNAANNNNWNGPIIAAGPGLSQVNAAANTTLTINGGVTSTGSGGTGTLLTRGAGTVVYNGVINLGTDRVFSRTDSGTLIVASTGNSWLRTQISDGQLQLGTNDALPNVNLEIGQTGATNGRFELNGFNQTIAALRTFSTSTGTNHIIRNSNLNSPSTLNFTTADATTDVLRATTFWGLGELTVVKNGTGRFELQDARVDNSALNVAAGTLAFTGTAVRVVQADIGGVVGATIEKSGPGAVFVFGAYDHAGLTDVNSGTLALGAGAAGTIAVADGATLVGGVGGGSLTSSALTFGTAGLTSFGANLTNPAAAPLINASTLTTQGGPGAVNVAPLGANIATGTYKLLQYGGGSIAGNGFAGFALGPVGSYPHMTANLVNNTADGRVDLDVTAVDSLIWTGATSGSWDINGTPNFKLASDGITPANFYQSDRVLFDNTGANKTITATGTPIVGDLIFDNSTGNDYSVAGVITGPGSLTKNNTGAVTLSGANSFTGPITVTGGTLILGGPNAGHGNVTVTGATLQMNNPDSISSAPLVTVSGGGTLNLNGQVPNLRSPELRVSGAGVGGNGAIVNNGATAITNLNMFTAVTFEGDVSWGGSQRNDLPSTVQFNGNGFTFTKVGVGETWFFPTTFSQVGAVVVNGGTFGVQTNNPLSFDVPVTVNTGAFHSIFSTVNVSHPVFLNDGGTFRSTNAAPIANGTVTLNGTGTNRFLAATGTTTLNIAGQITGTGGFTKNDTGTVQIRGSFNDYAGDTNLAAGTLNFNTVGSLPTTTNLIFSGGTLDPVNRTHTFASISGASGSINQATAGTGVVASTQATATTFSGTVNRATVQMDGTGSLTLAGAVDNVTGSAIANAGTLVLAKDGADLTVHSIGGALTINSGATVRLAGSAASFTGLNINIPPASAVLGSYVDQIFNNVTVTLNTGGVLDLNGRSESVQGIAGGGIVRNNAAATTSRLYLGNQAGTNVNSSFGGLIENGAGTVELEKLGAATIIIATPQTYTGATLVTGGTLQIDGSLANTAITIGAAGTLTGAGALGGSITNNGTYNGSSAIAGNVTNNAGTYTGTGTIGGNVVVNGGALNTSGTAVVTGTVTVNGGAGNIGGNVTGGITVNNTGTFNVGGNANGFSTTTITTPTLTYAAGQTRTLNIDLDGTAADRVNTTAANGLTLDGTSNVNILLGPSGWVTGSYPVYTYAGAVQGAGLGSLILASPIGHNTVAFANNGTDTVNLNVTAITNKWTAAMSSAWDINTSQNWNAADTFFANGDNVLFDDTAATFAPTLAANVTPAVVTFNNSTNDYTLSGAAGIAGTGHLVKTGSAAVTLSNPNTYTGHTIVQQGTLTANYTAGTALSPASTINVSAGATAALVHNGGVFNLANPLSGAGTVVIDPSTVTGANRDFAPANITWNTSAFTGTLNLRPTLGTVRLQIDTPADLGSGSVRIDNGGQVFATVAGQTFAQNFTLTGTGFSETAGFLGAIRAANNTVFTGTMTIPSFAKIGAHSSAATFSGNFLGGGTAVFGGNNTANANETFTVTGDLSALGGITVNDASTGAGTITLVVGDGVATANLGAVPIQLNTNAKGSVLRFRQGNDYVLDGSVTASGNAAFQADTFAGTSTGKGLVIRNTVNINGGNFTVGTANIPNNTTAKLTIETGASINAGYLSLGEQASKLAIVDHTGGTVTVNLSTFRVGHWPTETSTYNLSGGDLSVTAPLSATFPYGTGAAGSQEFNGGSYIGIDGAGVFNHSGGTFTTNFIVLDNRGNSGPGANMPDGVDQYNLSGGLLNITSSAGIISRNFTVAVNLTGGTIRAGTSFNLDSDLITVAGPTTIDTNANTVTLYGPLSGGGSLEIGGGGTFETVDRTGAAATTAGGGFGAGSLGAVNADIAASTTLASDRTGFDTWSGTLTGDGTLLKDNTGTLILTGMGNDIGATTVNAGTLEIAQSYTTGSLTIGAGATVVLTAAGPAPLGAPAAQTPDAAAAVPEPGSLGLLAVGVLGLLHRRRRA